MIDARQISLCNLLHFKVNLMSLNLNFQQLFNLRLIPNLYIYILHALIFIFYSLQLILFTNQ